MSNTDFWSDRYEKEGQIWLDMPSLTALFVEKVANKKSEILEVGFGYGRDIAYLSQKGYQLSGIEQSKVGYQMAQHQLKGMTSNLIRGNFLVTNFNQQYDIIYSHRVAHLFTEADQVEDFAQNLASTIKPKGKIFVSARDARGIKPKRQGHQVNFWDERRFETVFGKDFLIEQFIKGEEMESKTNPQPTYFTLMIAERRPQT